jgi:hypothetical protein
MQLPFSAYGIESQASSQRLINCYLEQQPEGAESPLILRRAPGIGAFSAGSGPGAGLHVMAGVLYSVSGGVLRSVNSGGTATTIGPVVPGDYLRMTDNGRQLYLSSGYVYDGALSAISDPDYFPNGAAEFLDNYLVAIRLGTGRFFCSDLAEFTSYDALNFATAEGSPDNLLSLEVDHRQAILFGEKSIEAWDNIGGADFPFQRTPNGFIEHGCAAKGATTRQDQSVEWLGNDLTLRRLSGNTAVRISAHGFEREVRKYASVSDCRMYSYTLDGHLCIVIRFPGVATWVYDCTSQQMHERQTYGLNDWDVSGFAEAYGKVFVQRASDGAIGVLSQDVYADFGTEQVVSWAYQNLKSLGGMTIDRVDLGIRAGVGLTSGQGSDPRITLEVSKDGGETYRALPTRSFGAKGNALQPVHWDRCGYGRNLVLRMSCSDPVPLSIWSTDVTIR